MTKITDVAPIGFKGEVQFFTEGTEFGKIKIKAPLKEKISLYVFLFKIIQDSFKDKPELKMDKFGEIFETSMAINGKKITEKQINKTFGGQFTIKLIKSGVRN